MPGSDRHDVAIILAAGRGARMGGPKALMRVAHQPWWMIQGDRLDALGLPCVWVVSPEVHRAIAGAPGAPARMIIGDPDAPMMASIVAGIVSMRDHPPPAVFVLPIDVPAPQGSVWQALRDSSDAPSAPTFHGRSGHPIRLPWSFLERVILPHAADPAWIASARVDHLVGAELVAVPVDDPDVTVNLNTPADVERWRV